MGLRPGERTWLGWGEFEPNLRDRTKEICAACRISRLQRFEEFLTPILGRCPRLLHFAPLALGQSYLNAYLISCGCATPSLTVGPLPRTLSSTSRSVQPDFGFLCQLLYGQGKRGGGWHRSLVGRLEKQKTMRVAVVVRHDRFRIESISDQLFLESLA